jgi:hypothetical protein
VFSLISVQIRLAYLPLGILAIILFFAIKKVGKRGLTISKIIVLFLATLLSSLYFASRVFEIPINRYREYLNSNRIGSIEAISAIPNFTSLPFPTADFIADSLASFFVLILPIYLYPISMNYIITSLFITLILTKYLFTIRKIAISASSNANSTLILLPLFFLFIAAVAEPDYGSFLRHLTPFLPLIYLATITLRDQQLYTSIKKRG